MTFIFMALLVAAAIILLWLAARERGSSRLPQGRIVYRDTGGWKKVKEPLYDPISGIVGKPDYLVKQGRIMIPVELKSGSAPIVPYDSHIFQLAGYCLLVERIYGQRPPYGILHYRNRNMKIDYTLQLEQRLLNLIDEIRQAERMNNAIRSHENRNRCRGCGFTSQCEQRL